MLYKIAEVYFHLLGTNGFRVREKSFPAEGLRCRQNFKYENFSSSFGKLRQKIAPKSLPDMQHDYFSLFNQSNNSFVALPLLLLPSFLKTSYYKLLTTTEIVLFFCENNR